MKTYTNKFGEKITKWNSNKHPDNPLFMQRVFWMVVEKPNGKTTTHWNLGYGSKTHYIYDLTLAEAIEKYT
jgi:hypothetical protein